MNIMDNFQVGGITGVIDWAETRILPFGMALWGVQNMLGVMDSKGWHYYGNAVQLEKLFWEEFYGQVGGISDVTGYYSCGKGRASSAVWIYLG